MKWYDVWNLLQNKTKVGEAGGNVERLMGKWRFIILFWISQILYCQKKVTASRWKDWHNINSWSWVSLLLCVWNFLQYKVNKRQEVLTVRKVGNLCTKLPRTSLWHLRILNWPLLMDSYQGTAFIKRDVIGESGGVLEKPAWETCPSPGQG